MGTDRAFDQQFRRFRRTKSPADLAPIFHGLSPRLMRSAQRAGLDEQGAEDVVQETFLAFLEAQERYDENRPLVPWIQGIALRQIRAERRRRARTAAALQAAGEAPGVDVAADRPMVAGELRRSVQGALSDLSEANRVVVSAAVLDGMGIDEMASRFGISRSAVSVRLHRGLARVRERLGERTSLGIMAIAIPRSGDTVPAAMAARRGVGAGVGLGPVGLALTAVVALVAAGWWGLRGNGPEVEGTPGRVAHAAGGDGAIPEVEGNARRSENPAAGAHAEAFLAGEVRLASGLPAPAGARVFALRTGPELVLPTEPLVSVAETAEKGQFQIPLSELPEGDLTPLLMVRAGADVGWVDADLESGDGHVIVLQPSYGMRVRVTDESGNPVAGASLAAFSQEPRFMAPMGPIADEFGFIPLEPYRHLFGGITDDRGIGHVGGLFGANVPDLLFGLSVKAPGYARVLGAYLSDGGTGMDVDVTLRRPGSMVLEGVAVDADGAPIEGVALRFQVRGEAPRDDGVFAVTGRDGRWAVPARWLDEFPLFLELDHPAYAPESVFVEQAAHLDGAPWTVRMQLQRPLHGTVFDGRGEPVSGAQISVVGARTSSRTSTDAAGKFTVNDIVPASHHVVLAVHRPADGPVRTARGVVRQGQGSVELMLSSGAGVDVVDVVLDGAESSGWSRCELVPAKGNNCAIDIPSSGIEGRQARFRHVPEGRWFVCGHASGGGVVVQAIDVASGRSTYGAGPVEASTLECLTCAPDGGANGGECLLVVRQVGVPELPGWLSEGANPPRTELYGIVPAGQSMALGGLVPGRWQVYASGDGWASQPVELTVGPGESRRVELTVDPAGAGRVSFWLSPVNRSCLLRIEVRRSELDPWHMVAMPSVAMGMGEAFDVGLPSGRWEWRAWLDTNAAELGALGLGPATHGVIELEAGGQAEVDVLAGQVAE